MVNGWGRLNLKKQMRKTKKLLPELSVLINLTQFLPFNIQSAGTLSLRAYFWHGWMFLSTMCWDLSQWIFKALDTLTLCRLNRTWTEQNLVALLPMIHDEEANICCCWAMIIWRNKTVIAKEKAWFVFVFSTHLPHNAWEIWNLINDLQMNV